MGGHPSGGPSGQLSTHPCSLGCDVLKIRAQKTKPDSLENTPHVRDENRSGGGAGSLPCRVWETRSNLGSKMGDFGDTVTCCEMPSLRKQSAAPVPHPTAYTFRTYHLHRCPFPTCHQISSQHGHFLVPKRAKCVLP